MTKPDDIEQKHWDVAKSLYLECWDCHGEMLGQGAVCETCRGKGSTPPSQSIVARAIQSAANAAAPKVKALEWNDLEAHGVSYAQSVLGEWAAWEINENGYYRSPEESTGTACSAATLEEAKEVAQADYEQRILSTLEGSAPALPEKTK